MVRFNPDFPPNDNLPPDLRAKLQSVLGHMTDSSTDAFNAAAKVAMDGYNQTPQAELGGFSPAMLFALKRYPMGSPDSPLQLADNLSLSELSHAKYFLSIRNMLIALRDADRIKATPKGNFTRAFVEQMVDVFLDAESKERVLSYNKVLNEEDVFPLHVARIICKISGVIGITKKQHVVQKKALPLLEEAAAGRLYKQLFITFFTEYNIGYAYRIRPDFGWFQRETGYVLMPLQNKAKQWLLADHLCQELLHPMVLLRLEEELSDASYLTPPHVLANYLLTPLQQWGLIQIDYQKDGPLKSIKRIRKTPLLDHFVSFQG